MKTYKQESGTILIVTTVFITVLMALGMSFLMTSTTSSRLMSTLHYHLRAEVIAHSAVEKALYDLVYGGKIIPEDGSLLEWTCEQGSKKFSFPHGGTYTISAQLEPTSNKYATLICTGEYNGINKQVKVLLWNNSKEVHLSYFKAIYGGGKEGDPQTFELTGRGTNRDNVIGDIHIQGDVKFSLDGFKTSHDYNSGVNNIVTASGTQYKVNDVEQKTETVKFGDKEILPPNLNMETYTQPSVHYKSWDSSTHDENHNVVNVKAEYDYYQNKNQLLNLKVDAEGGTFTDGTTTYNEWNSTGKALPDASAGNFFMQGYQNHFCDTFNSSDDTRMKATENYYLGQRNGGTSSKLGNAYGLYGGGHAVITINEEQNNKVYYVDGNLWVDSDGCNHTFFVPGEGVEKIRITIIARGNIYVGDQIFVLGTEKAVNGNQGGSNTCEAFQKLDENSAIAFIAMADGESYNDANKNGKYDQGEVIIGRNETGDVNPASKNPSAANAYATGYQGRMEGSGNIVYGDTISGPVGSLECFLFADNNFTDITADPSNTQNSWTYGNMTAGNYVFLNRNMQDWEEVPQATKIKTLPTGWVKIDSYYYPPGTTSANKDNPFVVTRRLKYNSTSKYYQVYARKHTALRVELDPRIKTGEVTLPGLPKSVNVIAGYWQPMMWINE